MENIFSELNEISKNKKNTVPALIADAVIRQFCPFVYNDELYTYNGGVYTIQTKNNMFYELQKCIPEDTLNKLSVRQQKEAVELVFARAERIDKIPRHYELLNVKNGVYDIKNNTLLPHDSKYKMTYILSVDYNSEAKSEKFIEFIKQTFKNRENLISNVQEVCGYLISDYPPIKEMILMIGTSNTSKSVFLSIIRNIVGNEYVNSVSIKNLENEYYLSNMCNKKLNICGELTSTTLKDLSLLKQLTSPDDAIQTRQIRQSTKMVTEKPKLVFATNHYPKLASDIENLDAFFNRIHIIPFEKVIPKEKQIDGYSDILFQEEGEGILLWMIAGYRRFLDNGTTFTHSKRVDKFQNEYRYLYTLPFEFVEKCIDFDAKKKIFTCEMQEYIEWFCECLEVDYKPEYLAQVRKILSSKGIENKKIRKKQKTKQGFYGVKFIYKKAVKKHEFYDFD